MGGKKFVRLDERLSYPGWIQGDNDPRRTRNPSDLSNFINFIKKNEDEVMTLKITSGIFIQLQYYIRAAHPQNL